jgi:3-hydroxybutyryl-CoA dehydrogenase
MRRIGIIGAGLMGHGIAQVFAEAGHAVAITDPDPDALAAVPARVVANLTALGRGAAAVERIELRSSLAAVAADADWVVEAAPERLELKRGIFAELERHARPDAILATNTSVIPVGAIAAELRTAARVVGTHWWNPPYLIALVEVVQGPATALDAVERTIALLAEAGKEPVHVRRDVPGFVGNRLQHALWREAIALVADGVCDAETVDRVVKASLGQRLAVMGPLETADLIGLDLTLDIHRAVIEHLDRTPGPAPYLEDLVADGRLGMRSGAGFREWEPGAAERARTTLLRHLGAAQEETTT